jgi:hypothetical protein
MTDLQDLICDRLVQARISRDWVDGPLHIAAQVIVPGFELADSDHNRRPAQLASTLKWPRMFCMAFFGGSSGLDDEDDRRALAIAIFRKFPPRQKQMRITRQHSYEVAGWLATRVHLLACSAKCPTYQALTQLFADCQARKTLPLARQGECLSQLRQCLNYADPRKRPSRQSTPAHHSLIAYRHWLHGLWGADATLFCGDSAREAVRTETKVRGVQGAIEICQETGERLGM